jgi:hypothetical protein
MKKSVKQSATPQKIRENKMTHWSDAAWILAAKAAGAIAGSAVSLAYMLPRDKSEAAIRFIVGIVCGLAFGGAAGIKIAAELDIGGELGKTELMLRRHAYLGNSLRRNENHLTSGWQRRAES